MTDDRDHRRNLHPTATMVQLGLKHGSKPRLVTESGGAVTVAIEAEESKPVGIGQPPTIAQQLAEIAERQRDDRAATVELAKGLGDVRIEQTLMSASLGALVKLAEKSDTREEKREERRDEIERLALTDKSEAAKASRSTREKIALALIAALATIAGTYAVGRSMGTSTTITPGIPVLAPAVPR